MIFKRKIYDRLLRWKSESNGEFALLLLGARRIGKTTIVEEFAKNEYQSYLMVDFSAAPKEVHDLFNDISNLDYIFLRLQFIYQVQLFERKSLIIFDEIQKQPLARQAIKHLVKDGRYDYIETGSLVSVHQKSVDILIPSEETKVEMYPMDFEEFKWALGDTATIPLLRMAFDKRMPLGDAVHRKLMRDFRLYMLVGGMPQAVSKFIETNNFSAVDVVKRNILSLYEEDLKKLDKDGKSAIVFSSIPSQLGKNIGRYKVGSAVNGGRIDRDEYLIRNLENSMTAIVAYHSDDPNVGLALTRDVSKFKMYVADIGLFVTLAFLDKSFTENDIYNRLLNDKLSANLGYVFENVIAQMLCASGKKLFYHTIPICEGKKYYEVDFVIADGRKISPIEVKSSGYKTHASLDAFVERFHDRIQNRYIIYTKDLKYDDHILYVPVYMTMFL